MSVVRTLLLPVSELGHFNAKLATQHPPRICTASPLLCNITPYDQLHDLCNETIRIIYHAVEGSTGPNSVLCVTLQGCNR